MSPVDSMSSFAGELSALVPLGGAAAGQHLDSALCALLADFSGRPAPVITDVNTRAFLSSASPSSKSSTGGLPTGPRTHLPTPSSLSSAFGGTESPPLVSCEAVLTKSRPFATSCSCPSSLANKLFQGDLVLSVEVVLVKQCAP